MFSLLLIGGLFSNLMPDFKPMLMLLVLGALVYFGVRWFAGPAAASAVLMQLAPRAAKLLTKIESLGLPSLAPVLTATAERRWADVPALLHTFLDQLDDKLSRRPILDGLIDAQLDDQLGTPEKREPFLQRLEKKLGVTIPRPTP